MSVDPDEFDLIVNTWSAQQSDRRQKPPKQSETTDPGGDDGDGTELVGVAVDGKAVRGAKRGNGTRVQLLSAVRHDTGMVVAQCNVDNDKTNEILAFVPLLEPLDIATKVVTADAMHTRCKAARFVVDKGGHYIFGVNRISKSCGTQQSPQRMGSTSTIRNTRAAPEVTVASTATGCEAHRFPSAGFPHANRYIIIERESSTLNDVRTSIETRYYVTDLAPADASTENLFRLTKGHWSIESLHWVRDVRFDEDISQVRTRTLPRILVSLQPYGTLLSASPVTPPTARSKSQRQPINWLVTLTLFSIYSEFHPYFANDRVVHPT